MKVPDTKYHFDSKASRTEPGEVVNIEVSEDGDDEDEEDEE